MQEFVPTCMGLVDLPHPRILSGYSFKLSVAVVMVMWSCDGVPSKACAVGSRNSPTFLLDQYPDLVAGCSYVLGWCGLPLQETKPTRRSDRVKEDLQ